MRLLRVKRFGTDMQGITLHGDKRSPEPSEVGIRFPGGEVTVSRCSDGRYWVHLHVNDDSMAEMSDSRRVGRVADARVDVRGKHAGETDVGDIADANMYHLAVMVENK